MQKMKNLTFLVTILFISAFWVLDACKSSNTTDPSPIDNSCGFALVQNRKILNNNCQTFDPVKFDIVGKNPDLYPIIKAGTKQTFNTNAYYYNNQDSLTVYLFTDGFPTDFIKEGNCDESYFIKNTWRKLTTAFDRSNEIYFEDGTDGTILIQRGRTFYYQATVSGKTAIRMILPLMFAWHMDKGFTYKNGDKNYYDTTAAKLVKPEFVSGTAPTVTFLPAQSGISIDQRGNILIPTMARTLVPLVRNKIFSVNSYVKYKVRDSKVTYGIPVIVYAASNYKDLNYTYVAGRGDDICSSFIIYPNLPKGGRVMMIDPIKVGTIPPGNP